MTATMAYCRFQVALSVLSECAEALDRDMWLTYRPDGESEEEAEARRDLIALCQRIASDHGGGP